MPTNMDSFKNKLILEDNELMADDPDYEPQFTPRGQTVCIDKYLKMIADTTISLDWPKKPN